MCAWNPVFVEPWNIYVYNYAQHIITFITYTPPEREDNGFHYKQKLFSEF